jgi:hypothetical protein
LEVSIATVILVYTTCAFLFVRNKGRDRTHAIFLVVFGSMQTVDACLHYLSLQESLWACSALNTLFSRVGLGVIVLEPFASLFARGKVSKKEWMVYLVIFSIPVLGSRIGGMNNPGCELPACTVFSEHGHLITIPGHCDHSNGHVNLPPPVNAPTSMQDGEEAGAHHRQKYFAQANNGSKTGTVEEATPAVLHSWESNTNAGNSDPNLLNSGAYHCNRRYGLWGEKQTELSVLYRLLFLIGIIYPYLTTPGPLISGLLQALIITTTWLVGYMSDSHASVWCLANVVQAFTMVADTWWFPPPMHGSPVKRGTREPITQDRYSKTKVCEVHT